MRSGQLKTGMGVDKEDGMACFIDFLIEVAVLAGLWIVISIIIIIAISWTHKW